LVSGWRVDDVGAPQSGHSLTVPTQPGTLSVVGVIGKGAEDSLKKKRRKRDKEKEEKTVNKSRKEDT